MILAGIDEAGYGPLLGPLVVSCAALQVPGAAIPAEIKDLPCLWTLLAQGVIKKNLAGKGSKGRLLITDSKVVHNLRDGDRLLERGVLAFLPTPDPTNLNLHALIEHLGCTNHGLADHPWYQSATTTNLPHWCDPGDLRLARSMLQAALSKAHIQVLALRTAVVCEGRYNQLVRQTNNKAATLISITFSHLYYLHQNFGHLGLVVGVDKQGGRDHYTQLLLQSFPDATLKVLCEDGTGSSYLLTEPATTSHKGRQTIIHFREKGETHFMATALASMTCKYLRELCMHAFNHWWSQQLPNLKPTAGYYQDGMRWLADVEPHLPNLKITREQLVRIK